jgi:hypothetical protein
MEKTIWWGILDMRQSDLLARHPGEFGAIIPSIQMMRFEGKPIEIEDGYSAVLASVDRDYLRSKIKGCEETIFRNKERGPYFNLFSDFRDYRRLRPANLLSGFKILYRAYRPESSVGYKEWVKVEYEIEKEQIASNILNQCAYLHVKMNTAHGIITQSVKTTSGKPADIYRALIEKYGPAYL